MDYSVWGQVLLELALSVSGAMELTELSSKVGLTFLRKLNCTYVGIIRIMGHETHNAFVFSVPKTVSLEEEVPEVYEAVMQKNSEDFETYARGQWFYVIRLNRFGYMVLRRPKALERAMVLDMLPIFDSFAHNLNGCLESEKRIRAEKALIREKTFLNALVNAIPDLFFYKDENGVYQAINDTLYRRFNKPFIGKTDWEIQPEPLAKLFSSYDQRVKNEGKPFLYEYEIVHTDGEKKHYETFKVPFYSEKGTFSGVIGISRDITERKHKMIFQNLLIDLATHLINTPEDQLDSKIEGALKSASTFMNVERSYLFLYDFEAEKVRFSNEWHAENIEVDIQANWELSFDGLFDDWIKCHKRGEIICIEDVLHLSKDSKLFSVLTSYTVKSMISLPLMIGEQCLGFIGFDSITMSKHWNDSEISLLRVLAEIITNLLVRKSYEHEMMKSKRDAERASESKGEFLANISHEVRTPLHGIMSMLYLLKQTGLNEEQQGYLDLAGTSATSLLTLVNDILDFSKLESGKLEIESVDFELKKEMELSMSLVMPAALSKNIELLMVPKGQLDVMLKGDAIRIRQVVVNLLSNAVKFTEVGHVHLVVFYDAENSNLILKIIDTGIGIPKDKQEHIFDRFTQVDGSVSRKYGGTGLGLSIVKKLVQQMRGLISFESTVGVGTTFSVQLRLLQSENIRPEILNESTFALLYGTDQEFRTTLLQFFYKDIRRFKENICIALEKGHVDALNTELINLKIAANNIGADCITRSIEAYYETLDAQGILKELQEFINYLESVGIVYV